MRKAQLMWCEPAPDARLSGDPANSLRTPAPDHSPPRVGPSITQNNGPTGYLGGNPT